MKQGHAKTDREMGRIAAFAAGGALLLSPVVVPAFAAQFSAPSASMTGWMDHFTPSGVDSRLAAKMHRQAVRSAGAFPFTPSSGVSSQNRTMTVAARADSPLAGNAVSVRSAIANIEAGRGATVRLNNSDYRLSASRGWQGFALPAKAIALETPRLNALVGNGDFRLDATEKKKPSRFNTDMSVAKVGNAANPRGNAAAGDYALNVGGSFSISRRIDLTAGVRYKSERDSVAPAASSKPDGEAVYVGTKIRF